jgi:hypothetical protein
MSEHEDRERLHAGKAADAGDHETTVEVDGRLIPRPDTVIEKDAGGHAHDATDWNAAKAAVDRAEGSSEPRG